MPDSGKNTVLANLRSDCFVSQAHRNGEKRDGWRRLLRIVNQNKSPWHPSESDRVCSSHFVDDEPSVKNPNPTLNLDYEQKQDKSRRKTIQNSRL